MGRWAQARRRGGGGGAAPLPRILTVETDGTTSVIVTFDRPVSFAAAAFGDASFDIDSDPYQATSPIDATSGTVVMQSNAAAGQTWSLTDSNPTWITSGPVQQGTGLTI